MLDLILTIACTSGNALIIKLSERRISSRLGMLFCNYIAAGGTGIVVAVMTEPEGVSQLSHFSAVLAIFGGAVFAANFFLYFLAIRKRGVALPAALMRLGAVVPLTVSILFFGESPSALQIAGIVGALAAAVMISLGVSGGDAAMSKSPGNPLLLALWGLGLLISFSIPDLINKLFQQLGEPLYKSTFLAIIFSCAAVFVGIAVAAQRVRIRSSDALWGTLLGFPNLFASYFLVSALARFPAYLVFPITSVSSVMVVAVVAVLVFRERIRPVGMAGMVLTVLSLVAINT